MVRQDKTAFAEKLIVFFGLLGALLYAIGTMWDVHIHVYYGHSQLAPPHLTVGAGILLYVFVGLILAAALVCYGCLIAWVELYTRLPQQGPEWPMMWLVWLPLILIIEVAATLFSRWASGEDAQRAST